MRLRFFLVVRGIPHEMPIRYCNIDRDRGIAIDVELPGANRKNMITPSEEEGSELTYGGLLSGDKRMLAVSLRRGSATSTTDEEMTRVNLDL